MSKNIIFPDGQELCDYLNDGYAVCNECGALMERKEDPKGGCDIFVCPNCGEEVDEMEYEYDHGDDEWTPEMLNAYGGNVPPAGCRVCGGPYPNCMTSCNMFDD